MDLLKSTACAAMMLALVACGPAQQQETAGTPTNSTKMIAETDVLASVNLTVAEGKRLIAKGIARLPRVQERMKSGMMIITKGSTNTYIAEELAALQGPHGNFLTGHFVPMGTTKLNKGVTPVGEIIFKDGQIVDMPYAEAVQQLQEGDIIFKGANQLNYELQQAAVCIGAADGGTAFKFLPYVGVGKAEHIVPIGLEKDQSADLRKYEDELRAKNEKLNFLPKLLVFQQSTIFTEIEALKQFADVEVFPYGRGGLAGREGGVSLVVSGPKAEVEKALALVGQIQGEKAF